MESRVADYGMEQTLPAGTLIFARGQRRVDFFLVLAGRIEMFETDHEGAARVFVVHTEGQFTGELDLFNDREILVSGRTVVETRVVRIDRAAFRRLVTAEPDIGEIIMRAFILRRVGLIRHGRGGVVLIGPGHQRETLRLERFLVRNAYPHRILDTASDPASRNALDGFGLAEADLPVVIAPGAAVMRNPTNAALADALGLTEAIDPGRVYDVAVIGAGPAGLAAAVYAASEGSTPSSSKGSRPAVRPAPPRRSRTISAFRQGSPVRPSPAARRSRPRSSGRGSRSPAWRRGSIAAGRPSG